MSTNPRVDPKTLEDFRAWNAQLQTDLESALERVATLTRDLKMTEAAGEDIRKKNAALLDCQREFLNALARFGIHRETCTYRLAVHPGELSQCNCGFTHAIHSAGGRSVLVCGTCGLPPVPA